MTEDLVDEAIAEQMLYYKKLGQRFEWKVCVYDKPADLKERLQAQGFKIGELETMKVFPFNAANPLLSRIIPSNLSLVTDEIEINRLSVRMLIHSGFIIYNGKRAVLSALFLCNL